MNKALVAAAKEYEERMTKLSSFSHIPNNKLVELGLIDSFQDFYRNHKHRHQEREAKMASSLARPLEDRLKTMAVRELILNLRVIRRNKAATEIALDNELKEIMDMEICAGSWS